MQLGVKLKQEQDSKYYDEWLTTSMIFALKEFVSRLALSCFFGLIVSAISFYFDVGSNSRAKDGEMGVVSAVCALYILRLNNYYAFVYII